MHSHGKKLYNNSSVDLESLRPARRELPRVLLVPTGAMGGRQRGLVLRSQLEQVLVIKSSAQRQKDLTVDANDWYFIACS